MGPGWQFLTGDPQDVELLRQKLGFIDRDPVRDADKSNHIGMLRWGNEPHTLSAGDVVFVKPDEIHQFRNTGSAPLKFLCLIPNSATGKQAIVAPECGEA